ncbi:MAG: hypothetical protein H5T86_16855, partial [Armatimonadetes bacterium]|nr:hypothetical protein [Armatimonadota bacterium]
DADELPDLLLALRPYLVQRGELLTFFHGQLRAAVQTRYLPEAVLRQRHSELAEYFRSRGFAYLRTLTELPYHLLSAERFDDLAALLTDADFIEAKISHLGIHQLLRDLVRAAEPVRSHCPEPLQDRFEQWSDFLFARQHFLSRHPQLFWQEAHNWAKTGLVAEAARDRMPPRAWVAILNRPSTPPREACKLVLEGHSGPVCAVAITPDGRRAVSGSGDNTLRIWDLETGECTAVLGSHNASDGAPGTWWDLENDFDGIPRIWRYLETHDCAGAIKGHKGPVYAVAVTPDGSRAVSGSHDRTLCVWDLETGECTQVLEGDQGLVTAVAFTPDGRRTWWCSRIWRTSP